MDTDKHRFDIQKPRYGTPCNHCGICCQLELCHIAEIAFSGQSAPCPALQKCADGYLCGLVAVEKSAGMELKIAKSLGIGCGCSMPDENTTPEEIAVFDKKSRALMFGEK